MPSLMIITLSDDDCLQDITLPIPFSLFYFFLKIHSFIQPIVEFYAAQRLQGLWHRANARKNWDRMIDTLRKERQEVKPYSICYGCQL